MADLSHLKHDKGVVVTSPIRMILREELRGLRFLQKYRGKCIEKFLINAYQAFSH